MQKNFFFNPILAGFYPDPSICKVEENYYLVTSTFAYFPAIPIFHSKDLVNWELIGHALNRNEQIDLINSGVSRGIFAPTIRYNNGLFYITSTLIDKGGNFVIISERPEGPYSNPSWLPEVDGIDPSLFFDDNNKAYLLYNSVAPENKPLYEGHRTIRIREFDVEKLQVKGEEVILVNGGIDIKKKPVWIEAPHIFKKDDFYYLIAAEGGTREDHSEVVLRSKNIFGPYIPYEKNPILTQRNLDQNRQHPITCTGHADFVQTQKGEWYAVFLGCRPYLDDYYNTGRETFLAPVRWIDGWPVITKENETVNYVYPKPLPEIKNNFKRKYNGNFKLKDNFNSEKLSYDWLFLRNIKENWYSLNIKKGHLAIKVRPETCSELDNPSFLGFRQQHLNCKASVLLEFLPQSENEKAGLLIFYDENHFYLICKTKRNSKDVVELYKSNSTSIADNSMELIATNPIKENKRIFLRIEAKKEFYNFF